MQTSNNSIILEDIDCHSLVSTLKLFTLDFVRYSSCSYEVKFDHTFPWLGPAVSSIDLVGCCNGICCATIAGKTEKAFFLWNPSIRKSIMKFLGMEGNSFFTLHGFGFDESSNDYKTFVGIRTPVQRETTIYLYSFKSNSRMKVNFPIKGLGYAFVHRQGAFVNGKFHWIMIHDYDNDDSNLGLDIVCFDLATEMYGGFVEKLFYLDKHFYPSIGVLSGCLCVFAGRGPRLYEIWVLKKVGVKEYWDKVMTLPLWLTYSTVGPKPLCITPEGELMFLSNRTFYVYDPKKDREPHPVTSAFVSQFNVCNQTLVWPFCDDEKEIQKHCYERLSGKDVMGEHTATFKDLTITLGEENPSDTVPAKRQRRSPTWMKDYYS